MVTEEQLLKFIKDNTVDIINFYFNKYNINSKYFNNFNHILLYLIQSDASKENIEYIIKRQKNRDNVETLFYSIIEHKFDIAKFLIKNNANINGKIVDSITNCGYSNILEYCGPEIDFEQLRFILNTQMDTRLITSRFICSLISHKRIDILKYIFNYKFDNYTAYKLLLNQFIINGYKNKIGLTDKQIVRTIHQYQYKNYEIIDLNRYSYRNTYPLLLAILINNYDIVKLIIDYADRHNFLLNINQKGKKGYFPFFTAYINGNDDIIRLLLDYSYRHNIKISILINESCRDMYRTYIKCYSMYSNTRTKSLNEFLMYEGLYIRRVYIDDIFLREQRNTKLFNWIYQCKSKNDITTETEINNVNKHPDNKLLYLL
ncbi:hypothetical protein PIROE2DRAFT_1789 [Piromyces sp. E2]|nr:hypothetical protein PIROE2DRAFT_1789 [Piromyces sp. E2]|eukprot:OUM70110.1 hypothetical protein PIROE2DRAFT_1789 [Piromyces sp. E2]